MGEEAPSSSWGQLPIASIITGVVATTGAGLLAAVISHGQQIAAIAEVTRVHDADDREKVAAMQTQIDRRFGEVIKSIDQAIADFRIAIVEGRANRVNGDEALSKRIDGLSVQMGELQRQVTAIEGRLGYSRPNEPDQPHGHR